MNQALINKVIKDKTNKIIRRWGFLRLRENDFGVFSKFTNIFGISPIRVFSIGIFSGIRYFNTLHESSSLNKRFYFYFDTYPIPYLTLCRTYIQLENFQSK